MDKTKKTWLLVIAVSLIVIASSATVIFNSSPNPKRISYQLPDTEIDEKYWKEIMNSDALIDQFKIHIWSQFEYHSGAIIMAIARDRGRIDKMQRQCL